MGTITTVQSWPANETERLLEAACCRRDQQLAFCHALLSSNLYLLEFPGHERQFAQVEVDPDIEPILEIVQALGETGVAAYTSEQILTRSHPEAAIQAIKGAHYFKLVPHKWLIVNPCGPYSVCLSPMTLKALLAGEDRPGWCHFHFLKTTAIQYLPLDDQAVLQPDDHLDNLLGILISIMKTLGSVRRAHIGRVQYEAGPPVITIGIDVTGEFESVRGELIWYLYDQLPGYDGSFDVVNLTEGPHTSTLAPGIRKSFRDLYARS